MEENHEIIAKGDGKLREISVPDLGWAVMSPQGGVAGGESCRVRGAKRHGGLGSNLGPATSWLWDCGRLPLVPISTSRAANTLLLMTEGTTGCWWLCSACGHCLGHLVEG